MRHSKELEVRKKLLKARFKSGSVLNGVQHDGWKTDRFWIGVPESAQR